MLLNPDPADFDLPSFIRTFSWPRNFDDENDDGFESRSV